MKGLKFIEKIQETVRESELITNTIIEKLTNKYEVIPNEFFVIILMFRKIIEKADGVFVLADNGSFKAAESITRDIFENYLYFNYMIDNRYKEKAYAYIYQTLKDDEQLLKNFDPKSKHGKDYLGLLGNTKEFSPKQFKERNDYIKARLKDEEFRNIRIEWENRLSDFYKKKKGSFRPTWFNLNNGPRTIKELSDRYDMKLFYSIIYSYLSRQVHSANITQQIERDKFGGILTPLRVPFTETFDENVTLTISTSLLNSSLQKLMDFFNKKSLVNCDDCLEKYISFLKRIDSN